MSIYSSPERTIIVLSYCETVTIFQAKSKSLRSLNLGQNRLSDLGIQKIKPGLIRNRSLRKLGLLNTRISNEGKLKPEVFKINGLVEC